MNLTNRYGTIITLTIIGGLIIFALFTFWGYQWGYRNGLNAQQGIFDKYQTNKTADETKNANDNNSDSVNNSVKSVPIPPLDNQTNSGGTDNDNNSVPLPPLN